MIRNDELNNLVEENNKKINFVYQSIKKLLGQDYNNDNNDNNNDFSDNEGEK